MYQCSNNQFKLKSVSRISLLTTGITGLKFKGMEDVVHHYGQVFEGLGRFHAVYKIKLKYGITPHFQPIRQLPYSLYNKLKEKLDGVIIKGTYN